MIKKISAYVSNFYERISVLFERKKINVYFSYRKHEINFDELINNKDQFIEFYKLLMNYKLKAMENYDEKECESYNQIIRDLVARYSDNNIISKKLKDVI